MKLFAISDLHLPFGADKPMDIFAGWNNYTERLKENWQKIVSEEDTVIIPGDFSWALKLEDTLPDFEYLNSLNGNKILLKGNHDFWWGTANKINTFLSDNKFENIKILHNNAYKAGDFAICGTRGWVYDGKSEFDEKVISRECGRLETSIKSALGLGGEIKCFLHYPFVYGDFVCQEILNVLKKYDIKDVYFGHIHGRAKGNTITQYDSIKLHCLSCDIVDFVPQLII